MGEKRRDTKGRILRNGESQRSDGRYTYVYVDSRGKQKFLYSWRLENTDRLPQGKRKCDSLREKIKQIQRDIDNGLEPFGGNLTVMELVNKYIAQKTGVRHNTAANYKFVVNLIKKEAFGDKRIDKIKLSDAKAWFIKLQTDGRRYSTIHTIRGVVRPAFQLAVDDDLIRKNPFDFQLATVVVNDTVARKALTRQQEREFLQFVREDKHFSKYYDAVFILFRTGMRISEFCGLTIKDIDFDKKTVNINHQLQRKRNMEYIVEDTKTESGTRIIPMTDHEVYRCFKRIIENRKNPKIEPVVKDKNGKLYYGFLYLDKNDMPMVSLHWEKYFKHICVKYNKHNNIQIPAVTPHICRHTYCSNMARNGMNPKTLQYLMGHADIGVTLNTYTHVTLEDVQDEIKMVCNKGNC